MQMDKDCKSIINQLLITDKCTIKQLALLCGISYRQAKSSIDEINYNFQTSKINAQIISVKGKGVTLLHKENVLKIKNYDSKKSVCYENDLLISLIKNEYLKIDDFAADNALSRTTVNKYILELKKQLFQYEILIESRPHYGLYISGSETQIRNYLFDLMMNISSEDRNKYLRDLLGEYIILVENIIAILKKYDAIIKDTIIEQLSLYVCIAACRIKTKNIISPKLKADKKSFEYNISSKFAECIADYLKMPVSESETIWLYRFVVGKCLERSSNNMQVNSNLINQVIEEAENRILEKYGYDFSNDIELYTSLSIHFRSLFKRAEMGSYSINPMIHEVKKYSLLAYDMAIDTSLIINKTMDVKIPDDEISYFAIYFYLAMERQKVTVEPKRALVICPAGKGMSALAVQYLKKQFGESFVELKACSYYELENINFNEFDYLFTMQPIKKDIPIPIIEFSLAPTKEQIEKIRTQINESNDTIPSLLNFSSPNLFFNDIQATQKEEILKQITERIGKIIKLDDKFFESLLDREKIVSTDMQYGFAIPHPLDSKTAEQSFFSVTVLKSPILWNTRKVQVILLSCIRGDSEKLNDFYESFAQLVSEPKYAEELIKKPTYEKLNQIAIEVDNDR